jgi:anti-sigma factor RsiW
MALSEEDRVALSAYLDGELDEAVSQQIEARISLDPEVRAEYETLRETWSLLDYLPTATPRPDFTSRTLERLSLEKPVAPAAGKARRLPAGVAWAAGVLIAVGVGYAGSGVLPTAVPVPQPHEDIAAADETLALHLRVVENWPLYKNAEDVDFLKKLDEPELFGDEPGFERSRP